MNYAYSLNSGHYIMRKYRVASGSTANAGGYVTDAAAGGSGVVLGLTTTVANQVGSTLDAATGSTTPSDDATAITSVIISPDVVYKFLIVKGATGGEIDVLTESAGGSKTDNTITTGETAPNSPTMDEGTIVGISGANKGQTRKITSVSATVATITEGWVNNNATGDIYILLPWTPADVAGNNINLTTDLANARADIAVGTGADFRIVELGVDQGSVTDARNRSYVYAKFDDHIFGMTT